MATKKQLDDSGTDTLLGMVLKNFAQDDKSHSEWVRKVEGWYKAFHAILEVRSKAAGWTSRQHPPYVHQIIQTLEAALADPDPTWSVRPRPRVADPAEIAQLKAGAKANELLLDQQADCDHLGEKQVVFAKQVLISGLGVYKTFWNYAEHVKREQAVVHAEVLDGHDNLIGYQPKLDVISRTAVKADDNTAEVVDVRDFIWHEAAISIEKAKRVTHRVLMTMEELRSMERLGLYKNVDKLTETDNTAPDFTNREQDLFQANRAEDMVEVLEQWRRTDDGIKVTSVGNRSVVLRDAENPFWHDQFPFVICQAIPDLFRIPGISVVDLIKDLQEVAWTLMNQRLDNTELLNNAIVLIREDADDYGQFEWAPGAQWIVQDPQQVSLLPINPGPAELSLQAEDRIKQDLQNIPGSSPSLLGQVDQTGTTATEVSLTASLGQRRISAMKQQFKFCHSRVGEQWMSNNQQFVREERLVSVIGAGGAQDFESIRPEMIQGDYYIDLEAMDESLVRQQRKAEAQGTFQVAMAAAPVFAALSQGPSAPTPMLNVKAFMDDVLEAAGISDKERYYLPKQVTPPQLGPPGQQNGQQPQQNGYGVTAPQASDQQSPSHADSMSPATDMQRMLSQQGGGVSNVPVG